jgi:hypothetical protein
METEWYARGMNAIMQQALQHKVALQRGLADVKDIGACWHSAVRSTGIVVACFCVLTAGHQHPTALC